MGSLGTCLNRLIGVDSADKIIHQFFWVQMSRSPPHKSLEGGKFLPSTIWLSAVYGIGPWLPNHTPDTEIESTAGFGEKQLGLYCLRVDNCILG